MEGLADLRTVAVVALSDRTARVTAFWTVTVPGYFGPTTYCSYPSAEAARADAARMGGGVIQRNVSVSLIIDSTEEVAAAEAVAS